MRCFKHKDRGPEMGVGSEDEVREVSLGTITHIAFVVGHQKEPKSKRGTTTYRGVWEWDYCDDVANRVWARVGDVVTDGKIKKVQVFHRNPSLDYWSAMKDLANKIEKWTDDNSKTLVIELHLNAAGIPEARGCEALIYEGDDKSAKVADLFIDDFSKRFKIKKRRIYKGIRGIKPTTYTMTKKIAGGGFNKAMMKKGFYNFLFEPFFCDYDTEESRQFCKDSTGPQLMGDWFVLMLKDLNSKLETGEE